MEMRKDGYPYLPIHIAGYLLIILSMILLIINYVTGSDNLWHALITALAGVYFGMFDPVKPWTQAQILLMAGIYVLFIILEYFIMGLPDPVDPDLAVYDLNNQLTRMGLINALTPFIYLTFKMLLTLGILKGSGIGSKLQSVNRMSNARLIKIVVRCVRTTEWRNFMTISFY